MWGRVCVLSFYNFRSLAKGGVDFPFRSPVTPPPPPATAWQQARQPRIESSASIAGGTKTRVSPGSDKETHPLRPLALPSRGRPSLYWRPDSDSQPKIHFPCSAADCHRPQTDRKSNIYRQAVYQKICLGTSINLNCRMLHIWHLNFYFYHSCGLLINVDFETKNLSLKL